MIQASCTNPARLSVVYSAAACWGASAMHCLRYAAAASMVLCSVRVPVKKVT